MTREQLADRLAVWLLNRDDRAPLDDQIGLAIIEGGGTQEHSGDCTKESHPCMRCIADMAIEDAGNILAQLESVLSGFGEYLSGSATICPNGAPTTDEKATLMGEFSFSITETDEHGNEFARWISVPWTTIKEIRKAVIAASPYRTKP